MYGIDLFAGAGGTSTGAKMAGVNILWAANHNPEAVKYHKINHPETEHICQDLHQADWSLVPPHDIAFASPCCQGHSRAVGKRRATLKADSSRSTAWAVVSCLEVHRTEICIIENVPDFLNWTLYSAWEFALSKLGYSLSINLINAKNLGIPQNRLRLFVVATKSKNPIRLKFDSERLVPARSIIDIEFENYKWDLVSNRVEATQRRVRNGRKQFGKVFLDAAYGSERGGRSLDKPIGTITTVNKHSLVYGDFIRPITIEEQAAAQSFPRSYQFPDSKVQAKNLIGNAVPPVMAEKVTRAVIKAA